MNSIIHTRTALALALGMTFIPTAQAALPTGTVLNMTDGVPTYDSYGNLANVSSGSWFGMDTDGNGKISGSEKTPLSQGPDGGIIIGVPQHTNSHSSHGGTAHPGVGGLDAEWTFFGNSGMHLTTTSIVELSASTLRFSGWTVTWNAIAQIPMVTGAWNPGNCTTLGITNCSFSNGVGQLIWNGSNNAPYTVWYAATVPAGDPSGFGSVRYLLHLEGTVTNTAPTAGNVNMGSVLQDTVNNAWTPAASDPNAGASNTSLTCDMVTQPTSGGTATVASDCSSGTYTPAAGYIGADSFTYRVNDGLSNSASNGTVSVNVLATGSNLPPLANDDTATAPTSVATSINVIANDTDSDGSVDPATVVVTAPAHGTATANVDGTVTYTSNAGFAGTDTFTYTVGDNGGATSNSATVTVTVTPNFPVSSAGTTLAGGDYDTDDDGRADTTVPTDEATDSSCIGGCFDFVVSGVSGSVDVVLPLDEALPSGAGSRLVYRKYNPNTSTWRSFTSNAGNAIWSAQGTGSDGTPAGCPAPGTTDGNGVTGYRRGLNPGDRCIQLTIVDNGDWDSNAMIGTVADPGGAAVVAAADPAPTGSSGGGCTIASSSVSLRSAGDWLLLLAGIVSLGLYRRRTI